jgi:AraC-like DNA-binding protein
MNRTCKEWSRYYQDPELHGLEALHAQFVEHRYARHVHNYFVIALVESGAASYWYRGAQCITAAGQVFVVNPDEPHTGEAANRSGYVYRVLYPRAEYLAQVAADIGTGTYVPFFKGTALRDPPLAILLSGFHKCLAERAPKAECESFLLRALARLMTRHADSQFALRPVGRERPAVRKAREYMEANFAEDVSLSKLASSVSLSPYYFARAFKREIGLPPHAYLETVRIQKARELLDSGASLVSTAISVGYADQSHLTHRFKRFLGITPGQYVRESKFRQDLLKNNL